MVKLIRSVLRSVVRAVYHDEQVQELADKHPRSFRFLKGRLSPNKEFGLYFSIGIVIFLIFFFLFFSFVENVLGNESIVQADLRIINLLQVFRTPNFSEFMLFFTYFGNWEIVFVGAILLCIIFGIYRKWHYVRSILFSFIVGELFVWAIKNIIQRPRPLLINALIQEKSFSFPSGHAFIAISFYGLLTYFLFKEFKTKLQKLTSLIVGLIVILFIGFSRIYLGVHWPSDVLASYVAGIAFLSLIITIFGMKERFKLQHKSKPFLSKKPRRIIAIIFLLVWICFIGLFYYTHPLHVNTLPEKFSIIPESNISANLFSNLSRTSEDLVGNPIEPINIIIIGNETELRLTFEKAGWQENDKTGLKSTILDVRALLFHFSYPQSPGAPSFWNAKPNDFAFEQPTINNSIHERNHIRFWKTYLLTDSGKEIWFATAHFDKMVIFKSSWLFITHEIDPFVDNERDKIKNDLLSTGNVDSVEEIQIVNQTLGKNTAGSLFYTDGKAEIIFLK